MHDTSMRNRYPSNSQSPKRNVVPAELRPDTWKGRKPRASKSRAPVSRNRERTYEKLLQSATVEFAEHGLRGARINQIALRARVDKRLVYYYFANKEALYTAVLEHAYAQLRESDASINSSSSDPVSALSELVAQIFDRALDAQYVAALVADENKHKAQHIRESEKIRELHQRLVKKIQSLLATGQKQGVFRLDVDAVRLFVSILGMSIIYFTNAHTLSAIFDRNFADPKEIEEWRQHIADLVIRGIRR